MWRRGNIAIDIGMLGITAILALHQKTFRVSVDVDDGAQWLTVDGPRLESH